MIDGCSSKTVNQGCLETVVGDCIRLLSRTVLQAKDIKREHLSLKESEALNILVSVMD